MDTSISLPTFWELTAPTESSQTELLRALYNYSSPPEVVTNSTAIWASQSVISIPLQKYNKKTPQYRPPAPQQSNHTHTAATEATGAGDAQPLPTAMWALGCSGCSCRTADGFACFTTRGSSYSHHVPSRRRSKRIKQGSQWAHVTLRWFLLCDGEGSDPLTWNRGQQSALITAYNCTAHSNLAPCIQKSIPSPSSVD